MNRSLVISLLALATAACSPIISNIDAGCYPAPTSKPVDSGVAAGCTTWTGGCDSNGVTALQTAISGAFTTAGACLTNADCALYGGTLKLMCYQTTYTPPIAMAQRGALDANLQSILCGFCGKCFADGGLLQGDVTANVDGGNCTEVTCASSSGAPDGGQCQQYTKQVDFQP